MTHVSKSFLLYLFLDVTISGANGENKLVIPWGQPLDERRGNCHVIRGIIPNSVKVLFDHGVGLQLKMTRGKKIGPFMGVFVLHSDPLTIMTEGIIGKRIL